VETFGAARGREWNRDEPAMDVERVLRVLPRGAGEIPREARATEVPDVEPDDAASDGAEKRGVGAFALEEHVDAGRVEQHDRGGLQLGAHRGDRLADARALRDRHESEGPAFHENRQRLVSEEDDLIAARVELVG